LFRHFAVEVRLDNNTAVLSVSLLLFFVWLALVHEEIVFLEELLLLETRIVLCLLVEFLSQVEPLLVLDF